MQPVCGISISVEIESMAIINLLVPSNLPTPSWKVNKDNHLTSYLSSRAGRGIFTTSCSAMTTATVATAKVYEQSDQKQLINRRSGNYEAPLWEFNYIQSLKNEYEVLIIIQFSTYIDTVAVEKLIVNCMQAENFVNRANKLKEQVKIMLDEQDMKLLDCLELVDNLERLGLSYHFESQINRLISSTYNANQGNHKRNKEDLYAAALEFRIFRQHGLHVPQGP